VSISHARGCEFVLRPVWSEKHNTEREMAILGKNGASPDKIAIRPWLLLIKT
ncbi:Hypothetical protein SMAX5B_009708, partial [Scophthalmus maximus]